MVIFFLGDKNSLLKARNRKNKTERNTHIRKKKINDDDCCEREKEENLLYQFNQQGEDMNTGQKNEFMYIYIIMNTAYQFKMTRVWLMGHRLC